MMEDEVKDFLRRIVWSFALGFLYLTTTLGVGAYNHLIVPDASVTIGIIIFYIWWVGSSITLVLFLYRIWKKKFPHG